MPGLDPDIHPFCAKCLYFDGLSGPQSGVTPGNDEQQNGSKMRTLLALLLIIPLLAGCLERGQPVMVDTSAR